MPLYLVTLPLTGTISVEVEAADEQAAIDVALHSEDVVLENIETWEACQQIVQGNVFYGLLNRATVEDISDEG